MITNLPGAEATVTGLTVRGKSLKLAVSATQAKAKRSGTAVRSKPDCATLTTPIGSLVDIPNRCLK